MTVEAMITRRRIAVAGIGQVASGALLFTHGGARYLAVLVKATFAMVAGGTARLRDPVPMTRSDVYGIRGSLLMPCDFVPYRPMVDVLMSGCARAPSPVNELPVSIALLRDGQTLLSKSLLVLGDPSPHNPRVRRPFRAIPLTLDRAVRGPDNPSGVDPWRANLTDPRAPEAVASFGPLSERSRVRREALAAHEAPCLDRPKLELATSFPWSFFNYAPPDQRIAALRGDEQLVVRGTSAHAREIETKLPGARASATLFGCTSPPLRGTALSLRPDALFIDAERELVSICWRGWYCLPELRDIAEDLLIVAALDVPGLARRTIDPQPATHRPAETGSGGLDPHPAAAAAVARPIARLALRKVSAAGLTELRRQAQHVHQPQPRAPGSALPLPPPDEPGPASAPFELRRRCSAARTHAQSPSQAVADERT